MCIKTDFLRNWMVLPLTRSLMRQKIGIANDERKSKKKREKYKEEKKNMASMILQGGIEIQNISRITRFLLRILMLYTSDQ